MKSMMKSLCQFFVAFCFEEQQKAVFSTACKHPRCVIFIVMENFRDSYMYSHMYGTRYYAKSSQLMN